MTSCLTPAVIAPHPTFPPFPRSLPHCPLLWNSCIFTLPSSLVLIRFSFSSDQLFPPPCPVLVNPLSGRPHNYIILNSYTVSIVHERCTPQLTWTRFPRLRNKTSPRQLVTPLNHPVSLHPSPREHTRDHRPFLCLVRFACHLPTLSFLEPGPLRLERSRTTEIACQQCMLRLTIRRVKRLPNSRSCITKKLFKTSAAVLLV